MGRVLGLSFDAARYSRHPGGNGGTRHASTTPGFEPCCRGRHLRSLYGAGTVMPERRIGCELCALSCEHAQGQRNRNASLWPSPHLHPRDRRLEANPQVPLALTDHYAPHTLHSELETRPSAGSRVEATEGPVCLQPCCLAGWQKPKARPRGHDRQRKTPNAG